MVLLQPPTRRKKKKKIARWSDHTCQDSLFFETWLFSSLIIVQLMWISWALGEARNNCKSSDGNHFTLTLLTFTSGLTRMKDPTPFIFAPPPSTPSPATAPFDTFHFVPFLPWDWLTYRLICIDRNNQSTMIIPVRCFTCGKVIGNKWETYLSLLQADYSEAWVMRCFLPQIKPTPVKRKRIERRDLCHRHCSIRCCFCCCHL